MEINTDEIFDTEHLSAEDLETIRKLADAQREGFDVVDDDPIARGLVNGYALRAIGECGPVSNGNRGKGEKWALVKKGLHFIEDRYRLLCTQTRDLGQRIETIRGRLEREMKLSWNESNAHKDVAPLIEQSKPLYMEMKDLESHFMRANLEIFGIEDMKVEGVLNHSADEYDERGVTFRDGNEAGRVEMLLSDLCGMRHSGLADKLGVDPKTASLNIVVERDGKVIGYVNSDGAFHYEAAPDLRTALGWKIATDGGRAHLVEESFDLDEAALRLLETINFKGVSEEAFGGPYFDTLKRIFVFKNTTRFADGCNSSAGTLWRVATRELGEEHPGYAYSY